MENQLTPAVIAKAKQAQSVEELLALAKENGMEISEEDAKDCLEQLHKTGELSDEELGNASGGGCHYKDGRLVVTSYYTCDLWTCNGCGKRIRGSKFMDGKLHDCSSFGTFFPAYCPNCEFYKYEHALMLCSNPQHMK